MVNDTIDSTHHLKLTLYISKLILDNLYEYNIKTYNTNVTKVLQDLLCYFLLDGIGQRETRSKHLILFGILISLTSKNLIIQPEVHRQLLKRRMTNAPLIQLMAVPSVTNFPAPRRPAKR